ncbi:hypothetical protein SAMN05428949_4473 [Chitinophaga sp. YR627]|nr:hypothetical protein SAMN05428949_4473 [Chitinophaga sp. YR627]
MDCIIKPIKNPGFCVKKKEAEQQFKIVASEPVSSYIAGITGGVEWTKTLSNNYMQQLYFA